MEREREVMDLMQDTARDEDALAQWDDLNVVAVRADAVHRAYSEYRDLGLTSKPEGEAGEALVAALCAREGWIIEVRRVSMDELPKYSGFVRLAGPNHWVIDVRDDVSNGQTDLIIGHEVGHILRGDVTPEGRARARVIPITPAEVWASAFAVTISRLFTYGDAEGEREASMERLPATQRAFLSSLGPRFLGKLKSR
jgi:hypothetical protein